MGFEGKNHRKDTKKAVTFDRNCLIFKWCHQESNRGHKDFQSFALPTELWHLLSFSFLAAKVAILFLVSKFYVHVFIYRSSKRLLPAVCC